MSLINEALKKAQGDRPAHPQQDNPKPGTGLPMEAHYTPKTKGHRRNFLWGFFVSVLVVGTLTTLLTAYFVRQILGPEGETPAKASVATAQSPVSPEAPAPAEASAPAPEKTVKPDPQPAPVADVKEEPAPITPPQPPMPPNPAVIARLLELEIRGIMSKGTRVLIFDQATGRTKAYRVGESLEGAMGLVVENISNSSIKFKDYAGQIHSKSF
jgi:hypothetical protein